MQGATIARHYTTYVCLGHLECRPRLYIFTLSISHDLRVSSLHVISQKSLLHMYIVIGERSEPLSGHVNGSSRYIYIYVRKKIIIAHALNQLLSDNSF